MVDRFINLTEEGHQITIFGSSAVYYFTSKSDYSAEHFCSETILVRSALKAVLTQTDYLYCKFITKEIRLTITNHLASNSYDFIVASFLYSAIALSLLSSSEKYIPDWLVSCIMTIGMESLSAQDSSDSSVRDHIRRLFLNSTSSSRFLLTSLLSSQDQPLYLFRRKILIVFLEKLDMASTFVYLQGSLNEAI